MDSAQISVTPRKGDALAWDMPESTVGIDVRDRGTMAWKCYTASRILYDYEPLPYEHTLAEDDRTFFQWLFDSFHKRPLLPK